MAELWWDPSGKMGQLHAINDLRLDFITDRFNSETPRILDIGCGGGILTEALAKSGARVSGIDLSALSIDIARQHAEASGLDVDYRLIDIETLSSEQPGQYDVVTCMEMLEHVPRPDQVIANCARLLKPGGAAVFSTINRTFKSWAFAIVAGEYILGLLPRGTHHYRKLIRPAEMRRWAASAGLEFGAVSSLIYNPLARRFRTAPGREDVNYMAWFRKPE